MNIHNSFIPAFRLQIALPYFVEFGGMGNLSIKKKKSKKEQSRLDPLQSIQNYKRN